MPNRLTKIYTRKGDQGYTTLRNEKISKDDLLIEALGTIDELNACLGLMHAYTRHAEISEYLQQIQNDLFDVGCELHLPERIGITAQTVKTVENKLDAWNQTLPPLKEFILPRGNQAASACHIARTVCRRAERCLVSVHRQVPLANPELLRYLNRLSDLLFVMARVLAREHHPHEMMWEHAAGVKKTKKHKC